MILFMLECGTEDRKEMNIANIITSIRILCGIVLIFCAPFSKWFNLIYVVGGITDVLDGFLARRFNMKTKIGAKLDTIADLIFTAVVLIKILNAVYVPMWLIIWIICIAVIKCISIIGGIVVRGKFVSEHTVLNKASGVLIFLTPLCINRFHGPGFSIFLILICGLSTVAAVQEGYYIYLGKEVD